MNKAAVPMPQIFDEIPDGRVAEALEQLKERGTTPTFVEGWFENLKSA